MTPPEGPGEVLAVDLGGTRIRAARVAQDGLLVQRAEVATRAHEGPDAVIDRLLDLVAAVRGEGPVSAVGIAAPGPHDPASGVILHLPNLPGWEGISLVKAVAEPTGLPVRMGNDGNLAALAEHRWGRGQGHDDLLYLSVGTGIGGGVISRGQLILGAGGMGGEVGHMVLEPTGPLCGCGRPGHLEALASGSALARDATEALRSGAETEIARLVEGEPERITAEEVVAAARLGDPLAQELLGRAGWYIGMAVASLIGVFNPSLVIIGGGVSRAGDLLFEPLAQAASAHALPDLFRGVEIASPGLGDDAGLLGAALLAVEATS